MNKKNHIQSIIEQKTVKHSTKNNKCDLILTKTLFK